MLLITSDVKVAVCKHWRSLIESWGHNLYINVSLRHVKIDKSRKLPYHACSSTSSQQHELSYAPIAPLHIYTIIHHSATFWHNTSASYNSKELTFTLNLNSNLLDET